jgi:ATP-dependent Clp protease ATP-binding subunit ClpA
MSQFSAEKFTTRSREAIEAAQLSATTSSHATVEPIHLLAALLGQAEGTARSLVTKAGADADALTAAAQAAVAGLPAASGATVAQHVLAVCYYAKNYGEDPAFNPWRVHTASDGYCGQFAIPTKEEVRARRPKRAGP